MITPTKVDEWIKEVEDRPDSAAVIIRYIANRLIDLTERNERLQSENLALMTEHKVEAYEARITRLEYQLELLKRQMSGGNSPLEEGQNLILFKSSGQVLRRRLRPLEDLVPGVPLAKLPLDDSQVGSMHVLTAADSEELLLVFDSGRTVRLPVDELAVLEGEALSWSAAHEEERRGSEELVAVLPIARMSLYEFCVQTSRRGFVKKVTQNYFQTYVARDNIGSGVKQTGDKAFQLTLCNSNHAFILISKEGSLVAVSCTNLPVAIDEVLKPGPSDHVVAAFSMDVQPGEQEPAAIALVTRDGSAYSYTPTWLDEKKLEKNQRKSLFSKLKRASGIQIAGAAPAAAGDWGLVLASDGSLLAFPLSGVKASGSPLPGVQEGAEALAFTVIPGHPGTAGQGARK